jgi:hypothetical protein
LGIKKDVLKVVRGSFLEMGMTEITLKHDRYPTFAEFAFVNDKDDTCSDENCCKIYACF